MDLNITEEQQQAFEEKHKELMLEVADAYGQALHRVDVAELALLTASLRYMAGYAAEKLRELGTRSESWGYNFGPNQ